MADESTHLKLPYILANQAQKHVTHNEAIRLLDALVQMAVISRAETEPPAEPADGDLYIVAAAATGDWAGWDLNVAYYVDGAWMKLVPQPGWRAWVQADQEFILFDGSAWNVVEGGGGGAGEFEQLGVNTSGDGTNRLAVKADAALFSHDDVTPGSGDVQMKLNKAAAGNTASFLFQNNFSGRAEFGLVGDDDFTLKVSPDGSTFHEGLVVDRASGAASFPNGIVHPDSGLLTAPYIPTPVREVWRLDATRPATPRTFTIDSVSGATLTLTTASVAEIFGNGMRNNAAVRVWNTSKAPAESAWVNWNNSSTELNVTDAADISSWVNGETLRLGDPNPTGDNTLQMVAIDISAYLFNELGTVFPQRGVFLGIYVSSSDGPASLDFSATGAVGSAFGGNALSDGVRNQMSMPLPTTTPSPISSSNLLFLREMLAGGATDLGVAFARLLGVYV